MRHLFIINPTADKVKGRVREITGAIESFFESNPQLSYDIHITRWSRDAVGFTRRYAQSSGELVRVYAVGGTGTVFEVVNGVIGLMNVQVAFYPFGDCNSFLRYFGTDRAHLFSSLRSLVFSSTIPIDAIRCGPNYGICTISIGFEPTSKRDGDALKDRTRLPLLPMYIVATAYNIIKSKRVYESYGVTLDGIALDGEYVTMQIANQPYNGKALGAAIDAHPNDGILDLYMIKRVSRTRLGHILYEYAHGNYRRYPDCIFHHTGRRVEISSPKVMCISLDGEVFYETQAECEIIPYAIDFVCPDGIDIPKLSHISGPGEEVVV